VVTGKIVTSPIQGLPDDRSYRGASTEAWDQHPELYCALGIGIQMKGKSESSFIAKIERQFPASSGKQIAARNLSLGIGDDAALFRPTPGHETILTCDWSLEGTHFLRHKHPADSIGWKCLARAVSDIAAMGGIPRCFLLSLALPVELRGKWFDEFLTGLHRAARTFKCPLAGGDTTRSHEILISITVAGEIERGHALRRDSAKAGDSLFVSGRLGEAEHGLQLLRRQRGKINRRDPELHKHLYPEPRLALAQWLAEKQLASAAMDLSDGLSTDLARLCAASKVGARIDSGKLPAVNLQRGKNSSRQQQHRARNSSAHRASEDQALQLALHGGDDYELLFTVPQHGAAEIPPVFAGLPLLPIGEITEARKILLVGGSRVPTELHPAGWDPFR
jgi:thiamine-monophosphate kinase